MGSWSDLFGRKMPMYLPSVGGLLATIVYIVVVCVEEVGVGWLCLASLLSGAFGGFTSVIANSFAYVASITEKEDRTLRYHDIKCVFFSEIAVKLAMGCLTPMGSKLLVIPL